MHVNMGALEQIMKLGLNRVSAFLGYGIKPSAGDLPVSLSLDAAVMLQVLPDPLPPDQATDYQNQFRNWVVGQGLTELIIAFYRPLLIHTK